MVTLLKNNHLPPSFDATAPKSGSNATTLEEREAVEDKV